MILTNLYPDVHEYLRIGISLRIYLYSETIEQKTLWQETIHSQVL
jgi:hypothetical protein